MAARAIWKGRIELGSAELPVKLYSAARDRTIHFRLLDEKRKEPVQQKMVDPKSGKVVETADIRRALEMDDGALVILSDEEMEDLEPRESRGIEITRFVKAGTIAPEWYDRPYWLGPDGDQAAYFAFAAALRNREREGVARWVMRGKEYLGVVRTHDDYLVLITLHHSGDVVPAARLDPPAGRELSRKEVTMARQIIGAMEDEFDLADFRDEYRDRVMELIEAKASGKVIRFPKQSRRPAEKPLAEVLEKSLEEAKGRKGDGAKGGTAKKRTANGERRTRSSGRAKQRTRTTASTRKTA
jgi:DNA end-binding protein Ku